MGTLGTSSDFESMRLLKILPASNGFRSMGTFRQHPHNLLRSDMGIHADLTRRTAELMLERAERGIDGKGGYGRTPSGTEYQRGGKLVSIFRENTPHD